MLEEYRQRLQEARDAGRGDRRARAQGGRGARARVARGRAPAARGAARADPPRHRGRDPAGDPGDPQRGRRPDGAGHREGDAQGAQPPRTSSGWSRRRSASSTSRRSRRQDGAERGSDLEEIAQVYSRSLFEVAKEHGKLDRDQRGAGRSSRTRSSRTASWRCSSSRPTSRPRRRRTGCGARSWAPTRRCVNFLELLIENHRMPVIFRIRRQFDVLWDRENRRLPVEVTSAVELDRDRRRGARAARSASRPARTSSSTSSVDPDILGGIVLRVGNSILDASIRHRLEQLRREVAKAALKEEIHADQARRDHEHPQEPHRGARRRQAPTWPRSAPCCRSRTASRACTGSRTACRSRCSSSRTT